MSVQQIDNSPSVTPRPTPIKAVYGLISLCINNYLIVVTKSEIVAQVFRSRIYKTTGIQMVVLSAGESSLDSALRNQLQSQLQNGSYYYSQEYDITNVFSRQVQAGARTLKQKKNTRYFYNFALMQEFFRLGRTEWITPFVHGSIVFNYFTIYSTQFNCSLLLVSRKDRERQGARWFCRGCDSDGHAACKVETEIIVFATNTQRKTTSIFSYYQVRAQIPLIWSQRPDMLIQPQIFLLQNEKVHLQIMKKYLHGLKQRHESVCLINLLDRTDENQKRLAEYYENIIKSFPLQTIRHTWFEFRSAATGDDPHKSQALLIEKLGEFINAYAYYHIQIQLDGDSNIIINRNDQNGLFRMTSMDCLLRTDLAQRVISKHLLHLWLYKVGVVGDRPRNHSEKFPDVLETIFNDSWQLNSSRLSYIYTGTTNIKQDLLQYGRRKKSYIARDYYNVARRYVLGTFYDWHKQNINDVLSAQLSCRGKTIKPSSHRYFLGALLLIFLIVWGVFQLVEEALEDSKIHNLLPIQAFWSFLSVMAVVLVVKNNRFLPRPEILY